MRRSEVRERVLENVGAPTEERNKQERSRESKKMEAINVRQLFPRAKARDRGWARLLDLGS